MNEQDPTGLRIVEDATCLGCACLCDDIGLVVEGGRIVEARNACELGRRWYAAVPVDEPIGPMIGGGTTPLDAALDRAAEVLASAKAPLIFGLGTTVEAQRVAIAIADRIGAAVNPYLHGLTGHAGLQRLGSVGATLGEIRDRADVIVFDSPHWPQSLPRLLERFVDPPGRFVPQGRAGRTVIVMFPGWPEVEILPDRGWTSPPDILLDIQDPGESAYAVLRAW